MPSRPLPYTNRHPLADRLWSTQMSGEVPGVNSPSTHSQRRLKGRPGRQEEVHTAWWRRMMTTGGRRRKRKQAGILHLCIYLFKHKTLIPHCGLQVLNGTVTHWSKTSKQTHITHTHTVSRSKITTPHRYKLTYSPGYIPTAARLSRAVQWMKYQVWDFA